MVIETEFPPDGCPTTARCYTLELFSSKFRNWKEFLSIWSWNVMIQASQELIDFF
jgi:hypothetical protein